MVQEPQAATGVAGAEPATGPVERGLCCWTRQNSSRLAFGSRLDVGHWAVGVATGAMHTVPTNATMDSTGPSDSSPQPPACRLG